MTNRDLEWARRAYEMGDTEESKKAHLQAHQANEKHRLHSNVIKSFTYGGVDGVLTTFAIISTAVGANVSASLVVIFGLSNIISNALSMACGDYMSNKTEIEFQRAEKARETWEVDNNPEGEMQEMEEIYMAKGMGEDDAKKMSEILSRNKKAWVDVMMVEELGIIEEPEDPLKNGLITFFSFFICGVLPLLPFIHGMSNREGGLGSLFIVSVLLAGIVLYIIGAVKSKIVGVGYMKLGLETVFVGAITGGVAYLAGRVLSPLQDDY